MHTSRRRRGALLAASAGAIAVVGPAFPAANQVASAQPTPQNDPGSTGPAAPSPAATVAHERPVAFDPLTASDAQLAAHGLPPRPPGGPPTWWLDRVRGDALQRAGVNTSRTAPSRHGSPRDDINPKPDGEGRFLPASVSTVAHHIYSGYGTNYGNSGRVTRVSADWTIPAISDFPTDTGDEVKSGMTSWIAIGGPSPDGSQNSQLVQAGSTGAKTDTTSPGYSCFWEVAPTIPTWRSLKMANGQDLPCDVGDHISVAISMTPISGTSVTANFSIWNQTAGKIGTASYTFTDNWGNVVRYITERPDYHPWTADLPDFHTSGYTNGYVFHNTDWTTCFPSVGGNCQNKNLSNGHNAVWEMYACAGISLDTLCTGSAPMGDRIEYKSAGIATPDGDFSQFRNEVVASCEPPNGCNNP